MVKNISVIVPVYNTKEYLKESIDSIIDQKEYIHEIILVDDGSTDGSGEMLDNLYSSYDFIKIHHTKNQRQGPARNLGTKESTGKYIYYFDSDDVLKPGLFKKFNEELNKTPELEIFCFSAEPIVDERYDIDEATKQNILSSQTYSRKINATCESGEDAFNLLFPLKSFSPLPYLYIFKKSIVVENNIKYRSIRFEDEEFVYQLFLKAGKTIISNEMYVDRRIREGSTMELERCFADMLGYIKTNETLNDLKQNKSLKNETIENINKKIIHLCKAIVIIKISNNLKLSFDERKIYKGCLTQHLRNNREFLLFYLSYPIEYKLRKLKNKYFN